MKAVPQIINNECGTETEGVGVGGEWEGIGLVQVGGGRKGTEEAQGVFMYVCEECGRVGGGGLNSSLGPLAKTPVGLTWQPHEAAWQEESCI